ncbi:hypothetical protein BDP27DRAFT_1419324 [Rhodocollybia butyracea]|uniref:Uncharacterized protein n=1 Tax=Rhodocollybia butyracea TaxID=206335 RepID=A0A9P5PXF7_9AGAR|nr:hypothetical protein BDP27DRAFT_1419324 [Rhodocollybia butyracea]
MAMKRKFDGDSDDAVHQKPKQLKFVPFPNSDNDCMMSEAEPFYAHHHYRNTSSTSSESSNTSNSPVTPPSSLYPSVDPYPLSLIPDVSMSNVTESCQTSMPNVGLLQPHPDFKHHGTNCSTIPKLRVACSPGLNGNRTMWAFCEDCGAISSILD